MRWFGVYDQIVNAVFRLGLGGGGDLVVKVGSDGKWGVDCRKGRG